MAMHYPLLRQIENPDDLKKLPHRLLSALCQEIRTLITETVNRNGGHLASNLGVVELTIALHRVFDSPLDKIIWDVGHQCYAHKILTGRRERFRTLRCVGGLSGFPRRDESPHDVADTGHASTSISSALGLSVGQSLGGLPGNVIAVIGDGALTGGMAWEALNHTGDLGANVIIVLNDNKMSIDKNVGAVSSYLSRLSATVFYQAFRKRVDSAMKRIPVFGDRMLDFVYRLKKSLKVLVFRESVFSHLGFEYVGPIDGHNIQIIEDVFRNVCRLEKPVVVHVVTQKGRGYTPAEGNPTRYHGVSPPAINHDQGDDVVPTFTQVFSEQVTAAAASDPRIVAVTAAMADGTGLSRFQRLYPDRFYDTGITEQHAVTFSAGLALCGRRPVVAIYSTFLQRAVDQIIHDVALPGLPVVFAVDRCGVVGNDGATHQGVFDIPILRTIPGVTILSPASAAEMASMLRYAIASDGPVIVRYPKAKCSEWDAVSLPLVRGRGVYATRRHGAEVLLACLGSLLPEVHEAACEVERNGVACDVYNLRFAKPLDQGYLIDLIAQYSHVFVIEDCALSGGIGERIVSLAHKHGSSVVVHGIGVADTFIVHGRREELLRHCGLDSRSIAEQVVSAVRKRRIRPCALTAHSITC